MSDCLRCGMLVNTACDDAFHAGKDIDGTRLFRWVVQMDTGQNIIFEKISLHGFSRVLISAFKTCPTVTVVAAMSPETRQAVFDLLKEEGFR